MTASRHESDGKPRQCAEKQRHYSADKGLYGQSYGLPSGHVRLWGWTVKKTAPKNWCLWSVVLEKTPESPVDCKEIKPVNPKRNQLWTLIGRTDAEAPILWPPDAKSWLIGEVPDDGKYWRQEEKRATEGNMAGWHHGCNGHELGQTLGDDEQQRGLTS